MPAGRPTKYYDVFTEKNQKAILKGYENGDADHAAIDILGIHHDTFTEWMKDERKPEFSACIKKGRAKAQIWWEQKGKDGVGAGKLNAAIYCFIMKNRFKETYGEQKQDIKVTNNYLDANVPKRQNQKEWEDNK